MSVQPFSNPSPFTGSSQNTSEAWETFANSLIPEHHSSTLNVSQKRKPHERIKDFLRALTNHDAATLLSRFVSGGDESFVAFKKIWKDLEFGLVFTFGFTYLSSARILEHLYGYLLEQIPKEGDDTGESTIDIFTVGIVYFIYSLYFSQPCSEGQCPAPVAVSEPLLHRLRVEICERALPPAYRDLQYALYRLFTTDAFQISWPPHRNMLRGVKGPASSTTPAVAELGSGDLMEVPTKNLKEQICRIDGFLMQELITTGTSEDLHTIAAEYDRLLERSSRAGALDALGKFSSRRGFILELTSLRARFNDSPPSISASPSLQAGGEKRGRSLRLSGAISAKRSRSRRDTLAVTALPSRPSTAPPSLPSRSNSLLPSLGAASDMPDFSFFNF